MKLFLKIKYNGTAFHGFQAQPNVESVQVTLTKALSILFSTPVNVTGCSRTDAGVHALGYVISVEPKDKTIALGIPVKKIPRAANCVLCDDIAVISAAAVPDDMHPRYDVIKKEYIYRIYDSFIPDPFRKKRVMFYGRSISDEKLEKANTAAKLFEGTHNFASFMARGSKITDPVRTVYAASVDRLGDEVVFKVCADGFLYNMVRIMAGTLLSVAEEKNQPKDIKNIIEAENRRFAGETVPPDGLYLNEVFYNKNIEWCAE